MVLFYFINFSNFVLFCLVIDKNIFMLSQIGQGIVVFVCFLKEATLECLPKIGNYRFHKNILN